MEDNVKLQGFFSGEIKPENLPENLDMAARTYGEIFGQSLYDAENQCV